MFILNTNYSLRSKSRKYRRVIQCERSTKDFRLVSDCLLLFFYFTSITAEWNSKKLDRRQYLNAIHDVCVLSADQFNNMAVLASDWRRNFRRLLWNRWSEYVYTWQEARTQRQRPINVFRADLKKQDGRHGISLAHLRLLLNHWT